MAPRSELTVPSPSRVTVSVRAAASWTFATFDGPWRIATYPQMPEASWVAAWAQFADAPISTDASTTIVLRSTG